MLGENYRVYAVRTCNHLPIRADVGDDTTSRRGSWRHSRLGSFASGGRDRRADQAEICIRLLRAASLFDDRAHDHLLFLLPPQPSRSPSLSPFRFLRAPFLYGERPALVSHTSSRWASQPVSSASRGQRCVAALSADKTRRFRSTVFTDPVLWHSHFSML